MKTLRGGISDLVNELNKLRNNIGDPAQQEEIQKTLRVLFTLWDEVIRQEINKNTAKYASAIESLEAATTSAKEAIADIGKVAAAIKLAVKAAKAVDKVVQLLAKFA
jgi:uncharacterized coiled-coil DUF342 family protein